MKNKKKILLTILGSITPILSTSAIMSCTQNKDAINQEKQLKFNEICQKEIKSKDGININSNILPTEIKIPSSLTIDLNNLKGIVVTLSEIIQNDLTGTISYIAKLKYKKFEEREITVQYPYNSFKKQLLTRNSNITDGLYGVIFEDKNGTLWSMGRKMPLQYFDKTDNTWKDDKDKGKTKNSNIDSGTAGIIFEDKNGTLWSMGAGTPLQYFDGQRWVSNKVKNNSDNWVDTQNPGKTNGSNITDGFDGFIFEDKNGILWSMGRNKTLQYFNGQKWLSNNRSLVNGSWIDNPNPGKTIGSNIIDGSGGIIFEDKNGTLWSMGYGTTLQYFDTSNVDSTKHSWKSGNSKKTKDSNINNGTDGVIFQSKDGTLWSMGLNRTLQYFDTLDKNPSNHSWKSDTKTKGSKTYGSNIINGHNGVIFEDKNGTLWSMGKNTSLQYFDGQRWVSNKVKNNYGEWVDIQNSGRTKGSNIINGYGGVIFEDKNGTLWSMGASTPLQYFDGQRWVSNKVKNNHGEWVDTQNPGKTKGSNIKNGDSGVIFEDKNGILWSIGYRTPLQYFDGQQWVSATS